MIIASSAIDEKSLEHVVKKSNVPYLLMDQSPLSDGDQVRTDDMLGGQLVAKHLLALGHKKIAIIMPAKATANILFRVRGFKQALEKNGFDINHSLKTIFAPLTKDGGLSTTLNVIDSGATATFAANDEMAIGLYRGLQRAGLTIPDDMSIVGYDGIDMGKFVFPELTTIQQPILRMGELAAELIINRISNPNINKQVINLPVKLLKRDSTCAIDV